MKSKLSLLLFATVVVAVVARDTACQTGVDFVKVDDISRPYDRAEVEAIRNAIDRTRRPMVLRLSPGETP